MIDQKPPMAATDIPEAWTAQVREIIVRCGHAVRASALQPVIEVKSLTSNSWHPLGLPNGSTKFSSWEDRNSILAKLNGR